MPPLSLLSPRPPHLLNAAKGLIPKFCKQTYCPTLQDCKREVDRVMEAEQWVYTVKNNLEKFHNIWSSWMYYSWWSKLHWPLTAVPFFSLPPLVTFDDNICLPLSVNMYQVRPSVISHLTVYRPLVFYICFILIPGYYLSLEQLQPVTLVVVLPLSMGYCYILSFFSVLLCPERSSMLWYQALTTLYFVIYIALCCNSITPLAYHFCTGTSPLPDFYPYAM